LKDVIYLRCFMDDKTSSVFGNQIAKATVRKAARTKVAYIKEFGDDSATGFCLGAVPVPVLEKLNGLYSFGSRLSQKSALFNRLYWEPLNSEGFRKLSYNAVDQKVSELMATPCRLRNR